MPDSEQEAPAAPPVHRHQLDEMRKQEIRETLARPDVNYSISICADVLGIPVNTIHSIVDRDPALAAKCPGKNAERLVPTETDILDREPPPGAAELLLPADQTKLMKDLMRKNDQVIRKGWRDIGLNDADAKAMEDAEKRAALPIGRVLAASEGHLLSLLARNARILDKIGDQLANGDKSIHGALPKITDIAGSDKSEVEYLKAYQNGVMVHVNIQQTLLKTRSATIDAMAKLKAMQADANRPEKGVFESSPNAKTDNKR